MQYILFISFLIASSIFNIVNSQSNNGVIINPFLNSCVDSIPFGVGYFLPFSQCIQYNDNNYYILLSNDKKYIQTYFLDSCDTPLKFNNSISYTYQIDSCKVFTVPNSKSFLSLISLTADIPSESVVYDYVYDSSSCSGSDYKVFYTNDYVYNNSENQALQYECIGSTPYLTTCSKQKCKSTNLGLGGCHNNTDTGYSYSISCYSN